jgi:hypothetical protein
VYDVEFLRLLCSMGVSVDVFFVMDSMGAASYDMHGLVCFHFM